MNNVNDDHEMAGLREHREAVARREKLEKMINDGMCDIGNHAWEGEGAAKRCSRCEKLWAPGDDDVSITITVTRAR